MIVITVILEVAVSNTVDRNAFNPEKKKPVTKKLHLYTSSYKRSVEHLWLLNVRIPTERKQLVTPWLIAIMMMTIMLLCGIIYTIRVLIHCSGCRFGVVVTWAYHIIMEKILIITL